MEEIKKRSNFSVSYYCRVSDVVQKDTEEESLALLGLQQERVSRLQEGAQLTETLLEEDALLQLLVGYLAPALRGVSFQEAVKGGRVRVSMLESCVESWKMGEEFVYKGFNASNWRYEAGKGIRLG